MNFPKEKVELFFKSKTQAEWLNLFKGHDVCVGPIWEIEELEDSHYHQAKGTFQKFETPNGSELSEIALPFKVS